MICRKCGARMSGPTHNIGATGAHEVPHERLLYHCLRCLYVCGAPTADATKTAKESK